MKPERQHSTGLHKLFGLIDFSSLKVRLWLYFVLFTVILVAAIWLLVIFFLNNFYEDMKYRETLRIVANIENMLHQDEPISAVRDHVTSIYNTSGIYIQIESLAGEPLVIPLVRYNISGTPPDENDTIVGYVPEESPGSYYPTIYRNEIENLKDQLAESGEYEFAKKTLEPKTERKTLEYAAFLNTSYSGTESYESDWLLFFVFSPLYPQESTSQILTEQLKYVTVIAVLFAALLGFYLARMITRPFGVISKRAKELAAGSYGISFPVTNYTEIMQLANTLSMVSNELDATRKMQRDIIANVSHDLKTPLTMIRSYAEMVRDISGDDRIKRIGHLQVIIEETDRLNAMIAELLDISRLQAGEITLRISSFSLKELIFSTISAYQEFVEQEGYKLTFRSAGEGMVLADETRIKQALDNLISNALKYGGKEKIVEIIMEEANGLVRVEVTDHGVGIPKRELKHVWDRYYQSSTHHQRSDSTGLGLSIVKEILLLHGARFGAESTVRRGSTFWFEIPVVGSKAT